MEGIQSITVDSTETQSELCCLGAIMGVDKSPYNRISHRHPYTAIYSLLFAHLKMAPLQFCEIGIGTTRSLQMWSRYFESSDARIYGFDLDKELVDLVQKQDMPRITAAIMDVEQADSITEALRAIGRPLDVLLDDSSHHFEDEIRIIECSLPFIKSGGMIIIEDVYRDIPIEKYTTALSALLHNFSYASFVVTDHKNRWSPGWDNDRLLVLIKK